MRYPCHDTKTFCFTHRFSTRQPRQVNKGGRIQALKTQPCKKVRMAANYHFCGHIRQKWQTQSHQDESF